MAIEYLNRAPGFALRFITFALTCHAIFTFAAPPTLEHIYPAGAQRDSTNSISLSGKFDPWPPKIWISGGGVSFNAETNKGKLRVRVAADAEPGPRFVRIYNDEGASEPRFFVVGNGTEIGEVEPNNHFAKAQVITNLPVTINGRLDKNGDVDSFAVSLRTGQRLDAAIDAYTLMSKLDAVLRLVNTNGEQIAWNHDFVTLDPRIQWRAPSNMTVIAQVMGFAYPADSDIRLAGGEGAVYRLHLDQTAPISIHKYSDSEKHRSTNETLTLPISITGMIGTEKEEHRVRVAVKKGQTIEAKIDSASLGFPLDAWLQIEDKDGKQLARSDDANNSRDPKLEWKAPSDDPVILAVGSVTHRGGPDFQYCLRVKEIAPTYETALATSSVAITAGSTNDLKFNLKRLRGFTNELSAIIKDLPEGISMTETSISSSSGDVTLSFKSTTNAPAFNGPVRVIVRDKTAKSERVVPVNLTARTENNGVPGGYTKLLIDETEFVWLTVLPKPAEKVEKK